MTTMIDIDTFLPEVLLYAPNTTDLVAFRFIIEAARELCERCEVWRETDEFEITAPEMQGVTTISAADILGIEQAYLDGQLLVPQTVEWLDSNLPGWDIDPNMSGSARYVTQLASNTVTVVPKATGTMKARLVLQPAKSADELPDFLLRDYATDIGRGAAGKVLTTPGQDANPQLGLSHISWFASRLDTLAVRSARGQQGAPLRTRGRYF